MTKNELIQLQKLPLEIKIVKSKKRIEEFYENKENPIISFSGGKDSTVLLDLVRNIYPDLKGIFVNTGLEFPEIINFIKNIKNIDIIYPKMKFKEVCNKYGYPVISKQISMGINRCKININKLYDELNNNKNEEKIIKYLIQIGLRINGGICPVSLKKQNPTISKKYYS